MTVGKFGIAVLLILIFLVIFFTTLIFTQKIPTIPTPNNAFASQVSRSNSLQNGFSPPEPITCPPLANGNPDPNCRGNCLFYETFSLENIVVDSLTPIASTNTPNLPANFTCLDGFIQALSKQTQTCQQETCVGSDGQTYLNGQSQLFYAACGNLQPCTTSYREAIVLNYQATGDGQFDPTVATCVLAEDTDGTINFVPGNCPSTVTLTSSAFLNIIPSPPSATAPVTNQIVAPASEICLQVINEQLVTAPCLSTPSQGFNWIVFPRALTQGQLQTITILDLGLNAARTYPSQVVNWDIILQSAANSLLSTSEALIESYKTLGTLIKTLGTSALSLYSLLVAPINLAIANGDCAAISAGIDQLKTILSTGNCVPPTCQVAQPLPSQTLAEVVPTAEQAIQVATLVLNVYNILGSPSCSGVGITSLQNNNNGELILAPFGNCPATSSTGSPVLCPYTTQLVPGQAWNCA